MPRYARDMLKSADSSEILLFYLEISERNMSAINQQLNQHLYGFPTIEICRYNENAPKISFL
jgi:hypothetical protein